MPAAGASILTTGDLTLVGGAAMPAATDLLTNVANASDSATPLFNAGDTLTLSGTKGGRTLPAQTLHRDGHQHRAGSAHLLQSEPWHRYDRHRQPKRSHPGRQHRE